MKTKRVCAVILALTVILSFANIFAVCGSTPQNYKPNGVGVIGQHTELDEIYDGQAFNVSYKLYVDPDNIRAMSSLGLGMDISDYNDAITLTNESVSDPSDHFYNIMFDSAVQGVSGNFELTHNGNLGVFKNFNPLSDGYQTTVTVFFQIKDADKLREYLENSNDNKLHIPLSWAYRSYGLADYGIIPQGQTIEKSAFDYYGWPVSSVQDGADVTEFNDITIGYTSGSPVYTDKNLTVSTVTAKADENATVALTVDEGANFAAGSFLISFPTERITALSVDFSNGVLVGARPDYVLDYKGTGKIKINFLKESNKTSGGSIADITFKIAANEVNGAEIPINIEELQLKDENSLDVSLNTVNGVINILNYVSGDLDGDGEINIFDAQSIIRYILGAKELTPSQIAAADVDGNGFIDVFDAVLIQQYDLGRITAFAE
jgi:hypothetical protein